jgi:RNase adapter protein RapZ
MGASLQIIVVTGMSGAGKSTALRVLEDLGYFCVDNLPTPLAADFVAMVAARSDIDRVALGIDARGRAFGQSAVSAAGELRKAGYKVSVLFLDASDEALVRRFSESRRPHPLARGGGAVAGITAEREELWRLRAQADEVIDTTLLSVHQLRSLLRHRLDAGESASDMTVRLISFGFRYGVPVDADMVLDVRFVPNPYFVEDLKPLTGTDKPVADFVLAHEEAKIFLDKSTEFLEFLIPLYQREGKSYLTVALGCTGGRHRSVALVEALSHRLAIPHSVVVMHRDMVRHRADGSFRKVTS